MTDWCRIGAAFAAVAVLSGCGADAPRVARAPQQRESVSSAGLAPGAHAPGASVRQRSLARDFAVFARRREPDDAVPGAKTGIDSPHGHIYLSESRRIAAAPGTAAWMAPADRGVCLVVAPVPQRPKYAVIACANRRDARRGELYAVEPGTPLIVQGVAADRVTAVSTQGRHPTRTAVLHNGYALDVWDGGPLRLAAASGASLGRVRLLRQLVDRPSHAAPPAAPVAPPSPMLAP